MIHRRAGLTAARALLALWTVLAFESPSLGTPCVGDCDGDGVVVVNELVRGVNVALTNGPVDGCRAFDRNGNGAIGVDELIAAVGAALSGCPVDPTATPVAPTATPVTSTATETPLPILICTRTPIDDTLHPSTACTPQPGRFADCFATSGLAIGRYDDQENGAAVADVDGDGFPDVFMWNGSGGARLYRNLGHDMQFEPVTDSTLTWTGTTTVVGAAFGDLDNDGRPDLVAVIDRTLTEYLCSGVRGDPFSAYRAYRNLGAGQFEDVSVAWGFADVLVQPGDKPSRGGLSLTDLNLDGRLDVVEYGGDFDRGPVAFLSQADGTSWKAADRNIFGDAHGATWNVFFTDADHDQLTDVVILNDFFESTPSRYYGRVDRSLTYELRSLPPVFGATAHGSPMGAATADLDGDGELDLVVSDSGDQHVFSRGEDVGSAWGVKQNPSRYGLQQTCWSIAVLDLENDGIPDLFFGCGGFRIGTPDRAVSFLLRNRGGAAFEIAGGLLPDEDVPTWEQGLATADFDQDGRLDLLTGGFEHGPRLLWNQMSGGHALAIRLKGRSVNAQGIGARVVVDAGDLPTQVREMFPGGGTWSYGDAQLLFGIGQETRARVTVDWRPAGGTSVQTVDLPPGPSVIEEP